MRKFGNVSSAVAQHGTSSVSRVIGHLAMLTDVCVHHWLRQPPGLQLSVASRSRLPLFPENQKTNPDNFV